MEEKEPRQTCTHAVFKDVHENQDEFTSKDAENIITAIMEAQARKKEENL